MCYTRVQVLKRDGREDRSDLSQGRSKRLNTNAKSKGSRSPEVVLHEVGLLLLFQLFGWNEVVNVLGGLLVDAMGDDVRIKLLPVVQAHDATEYFPLGDCELVVALKTQTKSHTHTVDFHSSWSFFPSVGQSCL